MVKAYKNQIDVRQRLLFFVYMYDSEAGMEAEMLLKPNSTLDGESIGGWKFWHFHSLKIKVAEN